MSPQEIKPIRALALALLMGVSAPAWAQASKPAPAPAPTPTPLAAPVAAPMSPTFLTVNGAALTEKDIDSLLARMPSQGKAVTPQMREQAIAELVVQRVLVDEAKRMKIDATPAFVERMEDARQRMLIEALVNDYFAKNPITEADEKAEYDRQKKVLGNGETTPQYQLRQVLVKTEQEGRDLIARAQKGEAFTKLAEASIEESSKANGGLIGWVFPTDLLPILSAVVVNLQKGAVAATPIQSNAGWHVLKLDDIRPFKIPSFEDSRAQIKQAVSAQRRQALVDGLMKKAVVKRP